jgi:hypothetical protein
VVGAGIPRVNAGSGGGDANRACPHAASTTDAASNPAHAPAARDPTSQPRRLTPDIMTDRRHNCTLCIQTTTNRNKRDNKRDLSGRSPAAVAAP